MSENLGLFWRYSARYSDKSRQSGNTESYVQLYWQIPARDRRRNFEQGYYSFRQIQRYNDRSLFLWFCRHLRYCHVAHHFSPLNNWNFIFKRGCHAYRGNQIIRCDLKNLFCWDLILSSINTWFKIVEN